MKQIEYINNRLIPALLTSPKLRVVRHLILLATIAFITTKLNVSHLNNPTVIEWLLLFTVLTMGTYLNIEILVPKFLLKNKQTSYLLYLGLVMVLSLILIAGSMFKLLIIENGKLEYTQYLITIVNASLAIGFVLTCSSTFLIFRNWIVNNQRLIDLRTATLESEMQQLKNQINPHFLFNMLNNANIMVAQNPLVASEILTQLDELLRYQIEDSAREKVLLSHDVQFLKRYLNLEKTRRDRFEYNIETDGDIEEVKVAPLLFIPFVENAVKHSPERSNTSKIKISFTVKNGVLRFLCENTKPKEPLINSTGGIGLTNIKRRLKLLYSTNHTLSIEDTETTYTVNLKLKL